MTHDTITVRAVGPDDASNIQDAIRAATNQSTDAVCGGVRLLGDFRISDTLRFGEESGSCPVFVDATQAAIRWTGSVGRWMAEYLGGGVTSPCGITGGRWIGSNKARGIRVVKQTECDYLRDMLIDSTLGCGLMLENCWTASLVNTRFRWCRGTALRTVGANSSLFQRLYFGQCRGVWHVSDSSRDYEVAEYEHIHGASKAREKYGKDYCSAWDSDTSAMIDAGGHHQLWQAVGIESSTAGERPLIATDASLSSWDCVRMENNRSRYKFVVDGVHQFAIARLSLADGVYPNYEPRAECAVLATGTTSGVRVCDSRMTGLRKSVLMLAGTGHAEYSVERCESRMPEVPNISESIAVTT